MTTPLCPSCQLPADGPMVEPGDHLYHAPCLQRAVDAAVDPDYDGIGEPQHYCDASLRQRQEKLAAFWKRFWKRYFEELAVILQPYEEERDAIAKAEEEA